MALSTTVPGSAHRGTRRRGLFRRAGARVAGAPVPALEEPAAESGPEPAHEATRDARAELVEHYTPAQLDPGPVFAAFARTVISAMGREISPQQAALDLYRHLTELDFRLAQARRQASNRAEAEAMAANLAAAHAAGTIPAPGTDEFDRIAAQNAVTMGQRARHVIDDPTQTGFVPLIKIDDELPAPAPSATGRVTAGGMVHRQDPTEDVAFPACVIDKAERAELLVQVRAGSKVFLPTRREVSCPALACAGREVVSAQPMPSVEVSTVPASGPQFPPLAEVPSPVHKDDDTQPVVPTEPAAEAEPLPHRPTHPAPEEPSAEGAEDRDAEASK